MTRRHLVLVQFVAVAILILAACGSEDEGERAGAPRSTTTSTTAGTLAVDWTGRFETPLPNGWVIRDCEGDRLNVCVYNAKELVGDIELSPDYPLDASDVGEDPREVARKLARDMVTQFRRDRADGCRAFTFEPERIVDVAIGTKPGARGGFTLTDRQGTVVERVINYYLVDGDKFAIVNVDAYVEQGGCLGPSEYDPSFAPNDLEQIAPYLDRIVADTPTSVTQG